MCPVISCKQECKSFQLNLDILQGVCPSTRRDLSTNDHDLNRTYLITEILAIFMSPNILYACILTAYKQTLHEEVARYII